MVTLTKTAVTLYDIEINDVWERMSHAEAQRDLNASRDIGDTIQEYDTTDRDGNPLRVVLQTARTNPYDGTQDMGGVYEFAR